MKLNREQYLSVYSEKNLSITANAGSGKTSVLTQKYLHLLLNNPQVDKDPSKIVAITFTKKAASEMKVKISNELNSKIAATPPSKELSDLKKIRNNFKHSRIQTIHSFCNDIIEKHPEHTGFIAINSDLTQSEENAIINNSFNDLILDKVNHNSTQLNFILKFLDFKTFEKILRELSNNAAIFNDLNNIFSLTDQEINQNAENLILDFASISLKYIIEKSKYLFGLSDIKYTEKALASLNLAKNIIIRLEKNLNDGNLKNTLSDISELINIKYSGKKIETFYKDYIDNDFKYNIDLLLKIIKYMEDDRYNLAQIQVGRIIFSWAKELNSNYQKRKKDIQYLDYNDQLSFALDLLNNQYVRDSVSKNISYLLIDEFQDTNYIQFEIVKKLIENQNAKLFIVGDQKQSIYGFRNSEIKLFKETTQIIKDINSNLPEFDNEYLKNFDLQQEESKGEIELQVSYRMNIKLAFLINSISDHLFSSTNIFSAKNTPIVAGNNNIDALYEPHLELLISTEKEQQAKDVSNSILEQISKGTELSDIGILARNNDHLIEIAEELLIRGIPFELHASENFFEIQEISDVLTFLDVINGNANNFNMVKLLQSYFFGLSDNDLLDLFSLNTNILDALNNSKNSIFNEIYALIVSSRDMSSKLNIIELIYFLIDSSNWNEIVSVTKISESISKNIQNLIFIVLDASQNGIISLNDFVEYVNVKTSSKETIKKDVALSKNKINLLTVHSSKGLEFDCVIIYDCNSAKSNNKNYKISKNYGISFNIKDDSNNTVNTPLDFVIKQENETSELEELKRLFYVAITRAKQKVIASAKVNKTKQELFTYRQNSFLDFLLNGLDIDLNDIILKDDKVTKTGTIDIYDSNNMSTINKNISSDIIFRNFEDYDKYFLNDSNPETKFTYLNHAITDSIQLETLTATKLNYLKNNKQLYKERYMYGMPESDKYQFKGIFKNTSTEDDQVQGTKKGIIVHAVLEDISLFLENDKISDKLVVQKIATLLNNEAMKNKEDFSSTITDTVFKVLDSPFIQNNKDAIKNSKTEVSFEMPFENDFLNGLIDLYTIDNNGNYEIWDWKTNNINRNEIPEKAEFYKPQMLFYSYLISFYNPKQKYFKARLFFTKFSGSESLDEDWIYTFEFTKDDLEAFENELKYNFKELKMLHLT